MSARTILIVASVITLLLACTTNDARGPTASPSFATPTVVEEEDVITRDQAIQFAKDTARPLFENLHSLGQYNTIMQTRRMSLGQLADLTGAAGVATTASSLDTPIWAVQINVALIGTPAGPQATYAIVGINAKDGNAELTTNFDYPLLIE